MPRMIIYKPCMVNDSDMNTVWECLEFKTPLISLLSSKFLDGRTIVGVRIIDATSVMLYTVLTKHKIRTEQISIHTDSSKCGPDLSFCEDRINRTIHAALSKMYPLSSVPMVVTAMLTDDNTRVVIIHDGVDHQWFTTFQRSDFITRRG